ncbi:hypothetical protein PRZ48_010897 [Zasmidium cellare]|uniref:Uncharacterized protein n=1 Tax=Zasmidium cellare TaxID=395010 RepID=A0ABR0EAS8_ZASCE|nr:hypothetical protein PRZ48_010897 [Zasmidium cellare]
MFPLNRIPNYGGPAAPGFYSATDWQDRHFRNNNLRNYGPGWQTNPQAVFGYRGGWDRYGGPMYSAMQGSWMGMQRPQSRMYRGGYF